MFYGFFADNKLVDIDAAQSAGSAEQNKTDF